MGLREELLKILGKEAETEKARTGTFVSRPVLNGAEWAEWAKSAGIPSPLAPDAMHVTVIYSSTPVQMIPDDCPIVIDAKTGAFALMGPNEDAFALAFFSWQLNDRNWAYQGNGAVPTWPTYRPHLTLSNDAAGFELDDATLADAPEYIILGAEVSAPLTDGADDDEDPEGVDGDEDGDYDDDANPLVIIVSVEQSEKLLERELNPIDATAVYQIAQGRPVTTNVLKRLGEQLECDVAKAAKKATKGDYGSHAEAGYADPGYQDDGKPRYPLKSGGKLNKERVDAAGSYIAQSGNASKYTAAQLSSIKSKISAAKKALGEDTEDTKKSAFKDKTITMTREMREVVKSKLGAEVVSVAEDEAQLMYNIANVYSIGGKTVLDVDGEGFTTEAMEQFIAQVLKRDKSSTWEHEGDPVNVVVQGLVLSDAVQKALGIDLGFECLVTATHFPDGEEWAKAKAGPWEQSIAGRFWYEPEGA